MSHWHHYQFRVKVEIVEDWLKIGGFGGFVQDFTWHVGGPTWHVEKLQNLLKLLEISWHDGGAIVARWRSHRGTMEEPSWHDGSPTVRKCCLFQYNRGTILCQRGTMERRFEMLFKASLSLFGLSFSFLFLGSPYIIVSVWGGKHGWENFNNILLVRIMRIKNIILDL